MATHFLGIDPGLSGALALLKDTGEIVEVIDMPVLTVATNRKTKAGNARNRSEYDESELVALLEAFIRVARGGSTSLLAVIESTSSRPGESAMAAHSFGIGSGILRGMLSALRIPYEKPYPATWKAVVMAGQPKNKEASVPTACRLWPADAQRFRGPRGAVMDGRADAVMLAEYGRRTHLLAGRKAV